MKEKSENTSFIQQHIRTVKNVRWCFILCEKRKVQVRARGLARIFLYVDENIR